MTVLDMEEINKMSGLEKAATFMLALGQEHGKPVWELLTEDEVKELSQAISLLGAVKRRRSRSCSSTSPPRSRPSAPCMDRSRRPSACSPASCRATRSPRSWMKSAVRPAGPCGTSSAT
ncbi:hypothetical protein [Hankyongella ginsenosidimutans]|uniref:hypothetical protein n=1 Tax=Hankyongella ginsenosidimutans TaxID=1763828 RepID=UPI00319DA45E